MMTAIRIAQDPPGLRVPIDHVPGETLWHGTCNAVSELGHLQRSA